MNASVPNNTQRNNSAYNIKVIQQKQRKQTFHVKHSQIGYTCNIMPKVFTSKTQKTGEIGENIAVKFLVKHGYSIIERNYTKKWGEIDIVAQKSGKLHFIEVKSVSRLTLPSLVTRDLPAQAGTHQNNVIRETYSEYQPEDNMHPWKLKRLSRTIQTYLMSNKVPDDAEWQVDLIVVYINLKDKKAKVKVVEDIIL